MGILNISALSKKKINSWEYDTANFTSILVLVKKIHSQKGKTGMGLYGIESY